MHSSSCALFFSLFAATVLACSSPPPPPSDGSGAEDMDNPLDEDNSDPDAPDGPPGPSSTARPNPFANAPPYQSQPPSERATDVHKSGNVGTVPSKDVQCLSCHGSGAAPKFLFGGSIYTDRDATAPATDMELGIIDAKGKTFFVHSDADGNFWVKDAASLAYPVYAAVRMDAMVKQMKTKISDATKLDCNSCHNKLNPIQKP
jgi:hypothetical protein